MSEDASPPEGRAPDTPRGSLQVVVGRVGRPHGIRGEVSVEVRTDEPDRRLGMGSVLLTDPPDAGPLTVAARRSAGGRLVVGFAGVPDRSAAEALRGILLLAEVDPDERPEDPDEFYDHQLVGLGVLTVDGRALGEVAEVLHLPGQDVLAVRGSAGPDSVPEEFLVPFVAAIVPDVDLRAGRVLVDPPPGLLPEERPDGPG